MNNNDWINILKLNGLRDYLSNNDSIQLSTSSKKLRRLFFKDSIKTFNFSSFATTKDYPSLFIKQETGKYGDKTNTFINPFKPLTNELIESKKKFNNDLKIFNGSPKKIVVDDFGRYHYLLNEAPIIFPNITTLVLNNSEFTIDLFQYMLDNFKYLENLELTENILFHNAENSHEYTINYPISLKSLKLGNNRVMMVQDKINPISITGNKYATPAHEFNGTYQHLPNLAALDHNTECNWPYENGDLFEFIRLNPQLESLKLSGNAFNFELFDIIKDYENLTHFVFDCHHYWMDLEDYEMPVLHNIKQLHLKIGIESLDEIFIGNFPNVNDLIIEFDGRINNRENDLIESFKNLKSLKLVSGDKTCSIVELTLPELNNLENLEFVL
jgi:hypothetical protein